MPSGSLGEGELGVGESPAVVQDLIVESVATGPVCLAQRTADPPQVAVRPRGLRACWEQNVTPRGASHGATERCAVSTRHSSLAFRMT